jgi:hypothetical protein
LINLLRVSLVAAMLVLLLAEAGAGAASAGAGVPSFGGAVTAVAASTTMTSTTRFTADHATVSCPAGTTLLGGGDSLTLDGAPVPNNGSVTLGLNPSDASGAAAASGSTDPSHWTAVGGYSGEAPGTTVVTAYGMCAANLTAATLVEVAVTATNTLGPVTAVCPAGDSLVGGGGGYTAFVPGNNTKLLDSFPSDAGGDLPTTGMSNPDAWTLKGNSNAAGALPTTAIAICATDVGVPTVVQTAFNSAAPVPGGSTVTTTATCQEGTSLIGGGSFITSAQGGNPGGPGNGGQGVHVIGDFPSDESGSPTVGSAQSWTVIAQDGGQTLDNLNVETFALCAKDAAHQLADLAVFVTGIGSGTSLADKVGDASSSLRAGNAHAACNQLNALANQTSTQSGKQLTGEQAETIIAAIASIQKVIGC